MLLIKNARAVYTMAEGILYDCDILIDETGKITKVGTDIQVQGAQVLSAEGLVAIPGIIDPHTHYGQADYITGETHLNDYSQPITPSFDIKKGIRKDLGDFDCGVRNGITTVAILPGSANVIGGYAIAVKTYGDTLEQMILKDPIGMKAAFGANPKGCYGSRGMMPSTEMSVVYLFEKIIQDTREYIDSGKKPYNQDLEKMVPVIEGKLPLKIHCGTIDIPAILSVCQRYGLRFTLEHAVGASAYVREIEQADCDVIFGPTSLGDYDDTVADWKAAIHLIEKGVNVALMTDGPTNAVHCLLPELSDLVRLGYPVEKALRLITINAAKAIGVGDRVGSIEPGKDGDIVLFRGIPAYDVSANVQYTIINGKVVYKADEKVS
ncbi:MAG: hypothetical protein DBX39_02610 [Bacillota bacterium]|nr:MAG: hypothetical protein DBX39_02610 [Bacillota bacterium]